MNTFAVLGCTYLQQGYEMHSKLLHLISCLMEKLKMHNS